MTTLASQKTWRVRLWRVVNKTGELVSFLPVFAMGVVSSLAGDPLMLRYASISVVAAITFCRPWYGWACSVGVVIGGLVGGRFDVLTAAIIVFAAVRWQRMDRSRYGVFAVSWAVVVVVFAVGLVFSGLADAFDARALISPSVSAGLITAALCFGIGQMRGSIPGKVMYPELAIGIAAVLVINAFITTLGVSWVWSLVVVSFAAGTRADIGPSNVLAAGMFTVVTLWVVGSLPAQTVILTGAAVVGASVSSGESLVRTGGYSAVGVLLVMLLIGVEAGTGFSAAFAGMVAAMAGRVCGRILSKDRAAASVAVTGCELGRFMEAAAFLYSKELVDYEDVVKQAVCGDCVQVVRCWREGGKVRTLVHGIGEDESTGFCRRSVRLETALAMSVAGRSQQESLLRSTRLLQRTAEYLTSGRDDRCDGRPAVMNCEVGAVSGSGCVCWQRLRGRMIGVMVRSDGDDVVSVEAVGQWAGKQLALGHGPQQVLGVIDALIGGSGRCRSGLVQVDLHSGIVNLIQLGTMLVVMQRSDDISVDRLSSDEPIPERKQLLPGDTLAVVMVDQWCEDIENAVVQCMSRYGRSGCQVIADSVYDVNGCQLVMVVRMYMTRD